MNIPVTREKYLDEELGFPWFIFGRNPLTGNVDIANANGDVFTNISEDKANRVIALSKEFTDKLYPILMES